MRIHALCIVKNEADILRQSLQAARAWCDAIYVLDNGSSDGTWELVQELARDDPAIVPWKQEAAPFHDNLRAQIYHAFADRAQPRDWWVRLDADEFYIDDPRQFLSRVPASTGCVYFAVVSYSTKKGIRHVPHVSDKSSKRSPRLWVSGRHISLVRMMWENPIQYLQSKIQ